MRFVYILRSQSADKYYIGYTSDLQTRVQWHNEGKSRWSRNYRPWELVYSERFKDKSEAISRERQIKKHKSRKYIEKLVQSGPVV